MKRSAPESLLLVEPIPNEFIPPWSPKAAKQMYAVDTVITTSRPRNFVYSPHFYDLNVLFYKHHKFVSYNVQGLSRVRISAAHRSHQGMFVLRALYFGAHGLYRKCVESACSADRSYVHQLARLCTLGRRALGDVPILVGEVGIPYDINGSQALRTGDYSVQHDLMRALVSALEENFASFTLWNYNPANTTAAGDGWNMEDFSIVNFEDAAADRANTRRHEPLYRGGRTLSAILVRTRQMSLLTSAPVREQSRWHAA